MNKIIVNLCIAICCLSTTMVFAGNPDRQPLGPRLVLPLVCVADRRDAAHRAAD